MPVPEKFQPPPEKSSVEVFYLSAFHELSTCRQIGFSVGYIPWTAVLEMARYYEFGEHLTRVLLVTIRAMDDVFLEWKDKEKPKD